MSDPYEVLGLRPGASDAEISAAYRALAKDFHPDRHPGVTDAARRHFEQKMAEIGEAYAALRSGGTARTSARARPGSGPGAPPPPAPPASRPPGPGECGLCGSSPARWCEFRYQNGFLLWTTQHGIADEFCRDCGRTLGRGYQNRTLKSGWWGLLAVLRNLAVVFTNARHLWTLRRLDRPRRERDVRGPLSAPLRPGPSVFARGGLWLGLALLAVVGGSIASAVVATDDEPADASDPPADITFDEPSDDLADWEVGSCVRGDAFVVPVHCSSPHDGRIVDRELDEMDCPMATDSFVDDGTYVFCIDLDR